MNVDELATAIKEAGDAWSDQDAAATLLEETRRPLLANLQLTAGDNLSMAAKEMWGLADPSYRSHIERMVEARRLANRAKVRWQSLQVLADLRRTAEASKRAELRALGG